MKIRNGYATIEEHDIGEAPTIAFGNYWPVNGWAGEITSKDVGKRIPVNESVFAALRREKDKKEAKRQEARERSTASN